MTPAYSDYLRKTREAKRMTKAELARRVKTGHNRINEYETGKRVPTLKTWMKILETLEVDEDEIGVKSEEFPEIKANLDSWERRTDIQQSFKRGETITAIAERYGILYQSAWNVIWGKQ